MGSDTFLAIARVCGVANKNIRPPDSVSSRVTMNVVEWIRSSPWAVRCACTMAAVIPPRQAPMMFTSGEPETSRATSTASIVACA